MNESPNIEQLIAQSKPRVPDSFRSELLGTIRESSRQQTRRDDFRSLITGVAVLLLVGLVLLGTLSIQHSHLIQTVLSAN